MERLSLSPQQREEKPAPSGEFAHAVLQDFYFSFYHSQGKPELQTAILTFLAREYKQSFPQSERGDLAGLKQKLEPPIAALNIPSRHTYKVEGGSSLDQKTAQEAVGGFKAMWDTEVDLLESVLYVPSRRFKIGKTGPYFRKAGKSSLRLSNEQLLQQIASKCLEIDIHYQSEQHPRPNRSESDDVHESFFRNYVVLQKSAQTERYDALYAQMGELVLSKRNRGLNSDFSSLANLWESNHPGEHFLIQKAA